MKIIKQIPHDHLRISIFKTQFKSIVKIDNASLSQSYSFREGSGIENTLDIETWLNAERLSQIEEIFKTMTPLLSSTNEGNDEFVFPEII